jgi:hypothetical protein
MDVLGSKWRGTGPVGRLEVRLPRPGDGLGTDPFAQYPKIRRRIAALRKASTELDYRKYKDLDHCFGLGTGTSAEGWVVGAIRFRESNQRSASLGW